VQQVAAGALQMPQGKITVETRRIGGAYGCKITRPAGMATAVALAAKKLGKPVKMRMRIEFQNDMVGKRNQFKLDYKVGFQKSGLINAIQCTIFLRSGAFFDFDSFAIAGAVATISNCYSIPNWSINGVLAKCNIPAETSARGPGWAAGVYLCERLMEDVASALDMDPMALKVMNLYKAGDSTPYKQPLPYFPIADMTAQLVATSNYAQRKAEIDAYNAANMWTKRGIAYVPSRFNVNNSFDLMGAVVSVFSDGTVQISTGGQEMGQGLNTKVAQACAMSLGLSMDLISVALSTTLTNPNNSGTGASITSESCVKAVMNACAILTTRLAPIKAKNPNATWPQVNIQGFWS
jgi:xanthine dehydrogenase molybdopterin-binding subunit B